MLMIRYLSLGIFSCFLLFLEQSIFTTSMWLINLNLILVFLVFIDIVWGFNWAFAFTVFAGIGLDVFSYLPFSTIVIILLVILFIVDLLYRHVFINFSFFSALILIFIATMLYIIMIYLGNILFFLIGWRNIYIEIDYIFEQKIFWQLLLNLLFMSVIFLFAKTLFKKLNLVFLTKRS
jgi:hypothetical protein